MANGLRSPEFHQGEDFRVILWRPEQTTEQEDANTTGKVAGKVRGKVTGKVAGIADKKIAKIIMAIRGNTVSTREIMAVMQLKGGVISVNATCILPLKQVMLVNSIQILKVVQTKPIISRKKDYNCFPNY